MQSAINSVFLFSYIELIDKLFENKIINKADLDILRNLRVVKKNYRDKIMEEFPNKEFVKKIIKVGIKIGVLQTSRFISANKFKNYLFQQINLIVYDNYSKLRLFEVYYYLQNTRISHIDKIVCNPQMYAFCFRNKVYINNLISHVDHLNSSKRKKYYSQANNNSMIHHHKSPRYIHRIERYREQGKNT